MPLLADFAITPDVFDTASYTSEEVCGLHLRGISEVMRNEGLVRDLRAGAWRGLFASNGREWHRWGKELVRKLATEGRLVSFLPELSAVPSDDQDWCEEALKTDAKQRFTGGIIVTEPVKAVYPAEPRVERIDRLSRAAWWSRRSPSVRLSRTLDDYKEHLGPILRCANSLQFIDPHVNPTIPRYQQFKDLLSIAGRRSPRPTVEVHRVCYEGSGPGRRILDVRSLEQDFRTELVAGLTEAGLQIEVFVWDDFHDRYLVSNLIGVSLQNGFDATNNVNDKTTWSRLGRDERDDVQREFDPAVERHRLHGRFSIP